MDKKQWNDYVYGLKPYIEKLRLERKEEQLVQVFQAHYPELEVSYLYKNQVRAELRFRKQFYDGICWRIYSLSDFDCKATAAFANADTRSMIMCSDDDVKNIYVGFMEHSFSDYAVKRAEQQSPQQPDSELTL